jgi:glutaredoxin
MTVTVYTLENCGYCKVAKELLAFKKVAFTEIKVPDQMTTRDFVSEFPGVKQFPLVLDEASNPIGGFSDLQEWLLERENRQLLNEQITGLSI